MTPVSDNNNTTASLNIMIITSDTTTNTNLANSNLHRTTTDDTYATSSANNQRYHFDSNVASSTMEGGDDISITIHAPEIGPIIIDTSTLPPESTESDVFLQTPISPFTDDDGLDNITISIDGDIDDHDVENDLDTSSELDSADLSGQDLSVMDADPSDVLGVGANESTSSSLGIGLNRRRKGKMRAGLHSASSASLSSVTSPSRQEELQAASKIVCPPPSPGISLTSVQTPNGSRRPVVPHQIANATTSSAYGVNVTGVASTSAGTGGSSSSNRSGSDTLFPVPVGFSSSQPVQGTSTASSLLMPPSKLTSSSMSMSQQFLTPAAAATGPAPPSSHDEPSSSSAATPSAPTPPPPITRIPVELLGEIFSHYVQGGDPKPRWRTADRPAAGSHDSTPLLLGRICRYWRMVSLLMPSLWSEITIRKPKERHVRLAAIWLQRSGRHPLTLTLQQQPVSKLRPGIAGGAAATTQQGESAELDGGGRMSALIREKKRREEEKVTIEIMKLFLRHIERWQDVNFAFVGKSGSPLISLLVGSIRSPLSPIPPITDATSSTLTVQPASGTTSDDDEESFYDESTNTIGGICPGSASVLRSACISLQGWDMQSVNSLWRRLYASVTLRTVDWIDGYKTTLPPNVPWEQLMSVNLGRNVDIDSAMFDVLPKCKKLQQLSLSRLKAPRRDGVQNVAAATGPTVPPNSNPRKDPELLFLPHLQSLTIKVYDPKISQLLDVLVLPSLVKLEIFQSSTERLPNVQSIVDLVKRSKCKLTHLAVMDSSTSEEELLKLIGMSEVQNYLKELEIWAPMTDRLMQALTLDWVKSEIDSELEGIDVRSSRWKGKQKCGSWLTDRMPVVLVEGNWSNDADGHSHLSYLNPPSYTPLLIPSPSSSGVRGISSDPTPLASASSSQPTNGDSTLTSLLPALQQIYLGRCRASDGRISDMVASRLRSRSPSSRSSQSISSSWSSSSSASSSIPLTPLSLYHRHQAQPSSLFAKLRRIGVHFDPRQLPVSDKAYLESIKGVELDVDMF